MPILNVLRASWFRWLTLATVVAVIAWALHARREATLTTTARQTEEPSGFAHAPLPTHATGDARADVDNPVKLTQDTPEGAPEDHFQLTDKGDLALTARTRLGIEALVGIYTPTQTLSRLQMLQTTLPPKAYAQLVELIERYRNYLIASRQLYPPDAARTDAGDALRELEDLHGLRATYLGAHVAEAFYGEEEKVTRQLLEHMQRDQTPGLTLQQKAERAQATYSAR